MGCGSSHTAATSARHKLQQTRRQEPSSSNNNKNVSPKKRLSSSEQRTKNSNGNETNDNYNVDKRTGMKSNEQQNHSEAQQSSGVNNNNNNNNGNMAQTTTKKPNEVNNNNSNSVVDDDSKNSLVNDEQSNNFGESASVSNALDQHNGRDNEQVDMNSNADNGTDNNGLMVEGDQEQDQTNTTEQQNTWNMDINMDLLNEYFQVDYEISQLESKDVLNLYHERIEQLEQLDQELDITSKEIARQSRQSRQSATSSNATQDASVHSVSTRHGNKRDSSIKFNKTNINIEEIFAKKILLERERDKLKQEVEKVILECDRLQQKYKKRDALLDKIFDGHFGSGLENHLEKQLDWLLEQKHYVDQVFYAWKRAETLATQACEQFSRALDEFSKIERFNLDKEQLTEVAKGVHELCTKSRSDLEKAQKYNPNVDAPFYTDNETDNFNSVIDAILTDDWNQLKKNKVKTTIEVAYKRALSVKQWLGQILQTTIARDSFELAEEYRWIAVQLRKERINLIKARVQESPLASFASPTTQTLPNSGEVNRDSGVESENNDLDLEEEIDQMLKKDRMARQQQQEQLQINQTSNESSSRLDIQLKHTNSLTNNNNANRPLRSDDSNSNGSRATVTLDNIQQTAAKLTEGYKHDRHDATNSGNTHSQEGSINSAASTIKITTPIEMDEETKKSLIAQIDKLHEKHRRQLARHQKRNQAKISDAIKDRIERRQKLRKESTTDPKQLAT